MPIILPTVPARNFSFTGFSTSSPTAQQPGDKLDVNLDAGFAFGSQMLTWSRSVIADAGGLQPGVVTMASLSPGLFSSITAAVTPDLSSQVTAATAAAASAIVSASGALSYATAAGTSATAASGSASTASTAAGQATYQAGLALASASLADAHRANAAIARSDASGFAATAGFASYDARIWADYLDGVIPSDVMTRSIVTGDHWSARWHANAANISAGTATTAALTATTASGSAIAAAALAQAANVDVTSKWNSFRTTYLGPQASPPTTDPLGGGVGPGDIYFDTTLNTMRVRTATSTWTDIGAPDSTGFALWSGGTFTGPITANVTGTLTGTVTGNVTGTATSLATTRQIALSGDATGTAGFNGSGNATIPMTLANTGVAAGTYALATVTVDAKGRVTVASSNTAAAIALTNATASTSTTTGALKVAGGLGVAGAIWGATVSTTGAIASGAALSGTSLSITGAGTLTGNLTLAAATPILTINKSASGTGQGISGNTAGSRRWYIEMGDNASEAGSNAGSNWNLSRYDDGGTYIGQVMSAARATGLLTFALAPQINTAPAADNQAARRRDVGMEWLATVAPTNVTWIEFALPSGYSGFRFDFDGVTTTSTGNLIAQVSANAGSTWYGAATDYLWGWYGSITPAYASAIQASYMCLSYSMGSSAAGPFRAILNIQMPKASQYLMYSSESNGLTSNPTWEGCTFHGAFFNTTVIPNRIRFAFASSTFGGGVGQIVQKGLRA